MTAPGLLPETQEIIERLEDASGFPVSCVEDPSLSVLATIKTGTSGSPVHVVRYRSGETAPDYQIAAEAGYALRTYARPPEERFHLSGREGFRAEVIEEVRRLNPAFEPAAAERLGSRLFDGLLLQLRSCPTGILVDLWLHAGYPGLRLLQSKSLKAQVREYVRCLAPELEQAHPKTIVDGNRAMNAAQAFFVADLYGEPHLAVPYRAAGLEPVATELLAPVTRRPVIETDDRELITGWAAHLGIADWIEWLPFA